jgi:hypothetical protein
MSLALVHSRARAGVNAPAVRIEVMLTGGLPHTQIVGLPAAAVRESRDRVRAALLCAQFEFPQRRITINLAPADLPKEGGRFDLAIALGILAASGQIDPRALDGHEFLGELALTGELRGVDGVLPAALAAAAEQRALVVAPANAAEAALAAHADVRVARTLLEVCAGLDGRSLPAASVAFAPAPASPDLRDVRGQHQARRALEVAAAGAHHLLLLGTPGCGKTLLASRLPGILPLPSDADALETATVASCSAHGIDPARWRERPFRAPHHTASAVSLVGCELAKRMQLRQRGCNSRRRASELARRYVQLGRGLDPPSPCGAGDYDVLKATVGWVTLNQMRWAAAMPQEGWAPREVRLGSRRRSGFGQPDQLSKGNTVGHLAELIRKVEIGSRADTRYWLQNPDGILDEACEAVDN